MATKQTATVNIRIYPKTHKRLKIKSAKLGISLAETADWASISEFEADCPTCIGINTPMTKGEAFLAKALDQEFDKSSPKKE